jgi:hypothetical protein
MQMTTTELLDALAKAEQPSDEVPPNTYSGPEIRAALGIGAESLQRLVRQMVSDGSMQVVPVRRKAIDGRMCRVMAYQILAPAKKRK